MWILPSSIASAFSAEPGASTWALSSDLALEAAESSLMWRGKPTPVKSRSRAWKKATWLQRLCGRMCQPSMDARFADWWTSCLAGSRVRTSLSPENERASQAREAGSGSSTSESSPRFSLDWSSLKTSRPSARAGSKSSSKTLPRSGTMRSGALSERPMLAQRITEIGCSFWPTPDASVSTGYNQSASPRAAVRPALARLGSCWQTPRATDGDKGGPNQTLKGSPALVAQAVRLWPTSSVGDGDKYAVSQNPRSQAAKSLHPRSLEVSSWWPTPTAHDLKDTGAPTEFLRKSPGLLATSLSSRLTPMTTDGSPSLPKDRTLNPRFVEWLMGWPIGWTDCDSQVTEWFLVKPLSLSARSLSE